MLLTVIREQFHRYSAQEELDDCIKKFGISFIIFTKLFKNQKLDELDLPRESLFNIKNWAYNPQTKIISYIE